LIAILGIGALAVVGVAIYLLTGGGSPGLTPQAALPSPTPISAALPNPTQTQAPTLAPTATPYPTYTPYPTAEATPTPYPTYTPYPTSAPTATPYPTYTPYPTSAPTATPYPTYTSYPTFTRPAPPPNPPTATPEPPTPAPASAPYVITLGRNIMYEPWGRPADPGGCRGPYDDDHPVRRLTVQALLTNNSKGFVTYDTPIFVSASGASLPSCYFAYDPNNPSLPVAQPGETKDVTFVTHLATGDYVRALVFELPGWSITVCLDGAAHQVPCN
jgi:hypothetical protein